MGNSTNKLIERYGKPRPTLEWETKVLALWDVPDWINKEIPAIPNRIYCNKDIIIPLSMVFTDLVTAFHKGKLKPLDSILTWDGCFNIRLQRNSSTKLSMHAWGIAVDLNAFRNRLGKKPTFSDAFVKIWESHGFIWGGNFPSKDGMHFEYNTDLLPKI